jgi:hypothetical protein
MNRTKYHCTAARLVLGAALAGSLLALPLANQAITYSYTDLNPSGFTTSEAYGISGGQQAGYGNGSATGTNTHALLWSSTATNVVDLNPSGFTNSSALGLCGSQQVGHGYGPATGGNQHALLWSGIATSVVDLNPSGFTQSVASGISGGQQAGNGYGPATGNIDHALLWSGTASSVVDLNPSGFTQSVASGISGGQQVGNGYGPGTGNTDHALLWSNTASSVVDLNPSGFTASHGNGISGGQQVGSGFTTTGSYVHALLWSGTASSVVDLNSSGFTDSEAYGISGNRQVGYGDGPATGNTEHAVVWSGTASSAVDLGSLLPSSYGPSYAEGIDTNGNVIGHAYYIPAGQVHAILWTIFIPNPVLSIAPMSFLTFSNLTNNSVYQLQQAVAWYWSNQPVSFTATNAFYSQMVAGVAGSGDYRLALSPVPAQAFATAIVDYGFVVHATLTSGGSGYVTSPAVAIVGGGGTNATAVSQISGGMVTNITITDAGIGYTNTPTVEIGQPPAAAVSPTVLPVMRLDSTNLAPYENYQIQFEPDLGGTWSNWPGGLFSPTDVTNSQYLFITNGIGFFRLQYVP